MLAVASIVFAAAVAACLVLDDYLLYVVTIGAIFASLSPLPSTSCSASPAICPLRRCTLWARGLYLRAVDRPPRTAVLVALPLWWTRRRGGRRSHHPRRLPHQGTVLRGPHAGTALIGHQLFLVLSPWTGGIGGFVGIPDRSSRHGWRCAVPAILRCWPSCCCWSPSCAPSCALASRGRRLRSARISPWPRPGVGAAACSLHLQRGSVCGPAGALFAAISSFVAPESFTVLGTGFQLVALVVVGGMGTLWGPILGAASLTALPEALRVAATMSLLAYGLLLLGFIIFAPKGIAASRPAS